MVLLPGHKLRGRWSQLKYVKWRQAQPDETCDELVVEIKSRLMNLGGLERVESGLVGGSNSHALVELLVSLDMTDLYRRRSLFPLNVGIPKTNVDRLLRQIRSMPSTDYGTITGNLVEIFLRGRSLEERIARINALYLVARLSEGNKDVAKAVSASTPESTDPFAHRSYLVALSFLGYERPLDDYAGQLLDPRSKMHQEHNAQYHNYHYGSSAGAILHVRKDLSRLEHPNLASLNVATLATLSDSPADLVLLERLEVSLATHVDGQLLRGAREEIFKRHKAS
jgi:hypothetical protein